MKGLLDFRLLALSALLGLAACASRPDVAGLADGDPRSARLLLEQVNRTGPMPVDLQGPIPGGLAPASATQALGANIVGASANLVARADPAKDAPRVLVVFGPPDQMSPWRACDPGSPGGSGFGDGRQVAVLVCDGPSTVAHARANAALTSAADMTQLLGQMGQSLFPDPRADLYRYDRYGGNVGYGGFGSIGSYGSNVGVGVGFGF